MNEQFSVGDEKISISIYRKTKGDKVISTFASERWFETEQEANMALARVLRVFTDGSKPYAPHFGGAREEL